MRIRCFLVVLAVLVAGAPASGQGLEAWLNQVSRKVQGSFWPVGVPDDSRVTIRAGILESGCVWAMETLQTSSAPAYSQAARRAILGACPLPLPSPASLLAAANLLTFEFSGSSVRAVKAEPAEGWKPELAHPHWPSEALNKSIAAVEPDCPTLFCFASTWQREIVRHMQNLGEALYSEQARREKWQGKALLQLQFTASGELMSAQILKSTGYELLDNKAIELATSVRVSLAPSLRGRPFRIILEVPFKQHCRGGPGSECLEAMLRPQVPPDATWQADQQLLRPTDLWATGTSRRRL